MKPLARKERAVACVRQGLEERFQPLVDAMEAHPRGRLWYAEARCNVRVRAVSLVSQINEKPLRRRQGLEGAQDVEALEGPFRVPGRSGVDQLSFAFGGIGPWARDSAPEQPDRFVARDL